MEVSWAHEPDSHERNERKDGWMEGWMDGWMDGWKDGWMGFKKVFNAYRSSLQAKGVFFSSRILIQWFSLFAFANVILLLSGTAVPILTYK